MKTWKLFQVSLLVFGTIIGCAGCAAVGQTEITRGVYTTVAMEGRFLDLPGSQYTGCKVFGPGQTPAAVVVGYGYWDGHFNHPQPFDLELIEAASGKVIFTQSGNSLADRAAVVQLPIRKSGDYKLKLIIKNSVYDTWDFTVKREATGGDAADMAKPTAYATGAFGVDLKAANMDDIFSQYDESLIQSIMAALQEESRKSNRDIFAQVLPGQIVVRFDLLETGTIASQKIVSNTLTDALGQFFLRALNKAAPFPAWPANARSASGTGTRAVELTFHYY
jgi:hypothetical protein